MRKAREGIMVKSAHRTWEQWLTCAKVADDPVSDSIIDARKDRKMPPIHSHESLRTRLIFAGACNEAIKTIPEIWRRFQRWQRS
jgi:hypothetical protein